MYAARVCFNTAGEGRAGVGETETEAEQTEAHHHRAAIV